MSIQTQREITQWAAGEVTPRTDSVVPSMAEIILQRIQWDKTLSGERFWRRVTLPTRVRQLEVFIKKNKG